MFDDLSVSFTFSRIDVIFKHISEQSVAFGKHLCRGTIHDSTGRNNVECRYNIYETLENLKKKFCQEFFRDFSFF